MAPARVLIVEDDGALRDVVVRALRAEGFVARGVADGSDALASVTEDGVDVLVIDIGLPDADGRDVCQALRARGVTVPVLFLTARHALTDRIGGFRAGGDDYVTKPFDIEELIVRLEALARRAGPSPGVDAPVGMVLNPTELTVASGDAVVTLTPTEFRVLGALAARSGRSVARDALIGAAWPHGAIVHDNTLDVYIARLRRKLGELPSAPRILTQHGVGYRLTESRGAT